MKISICMGTHNGSKYILKQINSILIQLKEDDELIISDDGSSDNTLDLIKSIGDNRIKIFYFNDKYPKEKKYSIKNHKISFNFLNALYNATGDVIFFSDQDDIWNSNKIEKQLKYLNKFDVVISNFSIIDSDDKIVLPAFYKKMPRVRKWFITWLNPHFTGCAMAFKREILNYAIPFPNELSCGHDNWIGLCANKYGTICFIDEPLFMHRVHGNNNSFLAQKSTNTILQKINWRLRAFFYILFR